MELQINRVRINCQRPVLVLSCTIAFSAASNSADLEKTRIFTFTDFYKQ